MKILKMFCWRLCKEWVCCFEDLRRSKEILKVVNALYAQLLRYFSKTNIFLMQFKIFRRTGSRKNQVS